MSDPIILGDQIIWLAKEWRDKCQEQRTANWTEPHRHYIGEAALLSPVDEGERKLVLYLSEKFGESKALTCPPGVRDNLGRPLAKDGFYCVLLHRSLAFQPRRLLPTLLHELIHVVDPEFLEDCKRKRTWQRTDSMGSALRQYALSSELSAFTGMWVDELRGRPNLGSLDTAMFALEMCNESEEFQGFYTYGPSAVPDLREQIDNRFTKIIVGLTAVHSEERHLLWWM